MDSPPAGTAARGTLRFYSNSSRRAYLFTNKRANRMKVLVHDGFGIWLAARRLNRGRFAWSGNWQGQQLELSPEQLQALVVGLPWQRLGPNAEIRLL
ncbi:IS66 family insertion sequence element accessory protein TnpB [Pseudomonas aeruginosa]|uniref:IS66 family insertion sequence element accessory protein TnpB n=1 Tax=Pseudomonas aeruginosa TaxID=287 RepID=UPI001301939E|nr:IS66 family insertion sequence element accessory protein TnpB [Pseudomonas aeruginosa]